TPISIYFTYNVPSGGERNSSATPHSYTVGDVCIGVAPKIYITSPANATSFLEPANITITADASDENGTVTKVDFYNGDTLLGTDETAPYSVVWNNILAGSYTIKAKATDNSNLVTTAAPVNITVNIPNTDGYCGTAVSGDYEWKAITTDGNVEFTFHPLPPIEGCNLSIIYIQENGGGYAGYNMTASGTDFVFTRAIANGTLLSIYFTYNTPPEGERNSSANPHSYIVGDDCVGSLPISLLSFTAAVQADGSVAVYWSTATELNNDYFLIEKSKDGSHYNSLTKVAASNTPATKNDYKVLDKYPVNGLNYYRLTQVDKDGKSFLSGVRTVNITTQNTGITVYPNPLNGTVINIKLATPSVKKLNIQLLSLAGKIIYSGTCMPQADVLQVTLPFKPAAGVYFIKVEGNAPVKLAVN
ncbi:MAG TPA: Ig-like domain-containing protein, partial [Chitinophagaceae bacterium]|nr:Ig-like domain-containing protein [Chitinophagaceae bacterium]